MIYFHVSNLYYNNEQKMEAIFLFIQIAKLCNNENQTLIFCDQTIFITYSLNDENMDLLKSIFPLCI